MEGTGDSVLQMPEPDLEIEAKAAEEDSSPMAAAGGWLSRTFSSGEDADKSFTGEAMPAGGASPAGGGGGAAGEQEGLVSFRFSKSVPGGAKVSSCCDHSAARLLLLPAAAVASRLLCQLCLPQCACC